MSRPSDSLESPRVEPLRPDWLPDWLPDDDEPLRLDWPLDDEPLMPPDWLLEDDPLMPPLDCESDELPRCELDDELWSSRWELDDALWLSRCEPDDAFWPPLDCPSPCDELLRSRFELLDEPLMPPLFEVEREPDPLFELLF